MKRFLKWFGISVIALGVIGFLAFLYFIPPFTLMKPEEFSGPAGKAGPDLSKIADPGERACRIVHDRRTASGWCMQHVYRLVLGDRLRCDDDHRHRARDPHAPEREVTHHARDAAAPEVAAVHGLPDRVVDRSEDRFGR